MADNKSERQDRLRQVLSLRELYHGRFTQGEINALLVKHDWNEGEVFRFIQQNEPRAVRQVIQRLTEDEIRGIQSDRDIARNLADGISAHTRLFSCKDCDRFWWRRVPSRKEVSRCHRCHVKYDPVPTENEWGWAIFNCECGNEFSGHGQRNVGSECYQCGNIAFASEIRPPSRRRTKRTRNRHSCNAPDCDGSREDLTESGDTGATGGQEIVYNRSSPSQNQTTNDYVAGGYQGGAPGRYKGGHSHAGSVISHVCVSPESRQGKPKVIYASSKHVSSGSTVDTFLDQGDLCSLDSYVTSLPVILE